MKLEIRFSGELTPKALNALVKYFKGDIEDASSALRSTTKRNLRNLFPDNEFENITMSVTVLTE